MLRKRVIRPLAVVVTAAILATTVTLPAQAALLPTETVVTPAAAAQRARVAELLARAEVRERLAAMGVDPAQLDARLAALTDEEAARLSARLDELPAGGDSVLALAVFVFLVLLLTDILGYTDIFPFVKKTAR
jgi:hypothetical protein